MKVILGIIGILILLVALFFFWLSYSSPVNEAGRDFNRTVRSYRNEEIETMDGVYERLEVLDNHFHSATFDKVQGGEKTEVNISHIKTLFGEPHEVLKDVALPNIETVYRYNYEAITLNFHERFRSITEFVIHDFNEKIYEEEFLDQLFIEAINNHQALIPDETQTSGFINEEEASRFILEKPPTRKVRQNGWYRWAYSRKNYYDNGAGEEILSEYLTLEFEEEEATELRIMERRYPIVSLKAPTAEESTRMKDEIDRFRVVFEQEETEDGDQKLKIADLSEEFGEVASLYYDFRQKEVGIYWYLPVDDYLVELRAIASIEESMDLSHMNDLAALEVTDFSDQRHYDLDEALVRNAFIKSE